MMDINAETFRELDAAAVPQIFEACAEELLHGDSSNVHQNEQFASWPSERSEQLVETVKIFIQKVALDLVTKEEFKETLNWMNRDTEELIYKYIDIRRNGIKKRILLKELQQVHHLADFDYNVKMSVSSNKILNLNEPYLSLFLHTKSPDRPDRMLHIEMTTEEVHSVIALLKDAKARLLDHGNSS